MDNDELLASVAEHCSAFYTFGEETGHLCTERYCVYAEIVATHECTDDCDYPCFVRVAKDYVLAGPPDLPIYKDGYWESLAGTPELEDDDEEEEEDGEEEVSLDSDPTTAEWENRFGGDD